MVNMSNYAEVSYSFPGKILRETREQDSGPQRVKHYKQIWPHLQSRIKQMIVLEIQTQNELQHNLKHMFINFGRNPVVTELLQSPNTDIDKLLDIESFPAQFQTCNPKLEKYMDMSKYNRLVEYITQVGDPNNRSRAYKYPLVAADILSIDNRETVDALMKEGKIIVERKEVEERWVEKEVDQCDSQYCSSEESSSGQNAQEFFETSDRQNIPPANQNGEQKNGSRLSINSKKKKSDKNSDSGSQGRKSLGASSASITSDDFPFAEQVTKKIKVKQLITRNVEIQIKPLLQQLCEFYQKQVNYTLTAYVTKVLEFLLKKNPRRILRQLFATKNHKHLMKHLESQVVCDFVVNIILCPENEVENAREYLLTVLLKNLVSWHNEEDKLIFNKSIVYILVEINSKLDPQAQKWYSVVMEYLYQEPSLAKISSLLFNPKTTFKNRDLFAQLLQQFLKKLINPIIINAPNTASSAIKTTQQENSKELRQNLLSKYEVCFKEFIDNLWQILVHSQDNIPSYVYIRYLQILNMLIKNNLFWARIELSNQQDIFGPLLKLCQKFKNNNFVHNQIFQLFREIVHHVNEMPILFKKTFSCKNFLNFCLETVCDNGSSSNLMYRGHCIYLCEAIRHSNYEEAKSLKLQFKNKWIKIEESQLLNVEKMNSTLGGFLVKRPHKTEVQFKKEDILKKFQLFLKGQIPLKKSKSLQQQELEDIHSQGSSQWSDWNQFSNYSADEIDQK